MTEPGVEESDPIGNALTVAAELVELGVSPQQSVFLGYFVSFPDPGTAAAAAHNARSDCWHTCMYRASTGLVVRLSRHGPATIRRLRRDWDYMGDFARRNNGHWEAVAIEELAPDTYWEMIALRLARRSTVRLFPRGLRQGRQELVELGEIRG
jgi:hypothetical protein